MRLIFLDFGFPRRCPASSGGAPTNDDQSKPQKEQNIFRRNDDPNSTAPTTATSILNQIQGTAVSKA
jgi:hypothetical protein